jgi:hypothetical protein
MTFPVYLDLFGARLHPHVVFETLAYFLGFRVYLWLRRRQADDIPSPTRWWPSLRLRWAAPSAASALAWLEDPAALQAQ